MRGLIELVSYDNYVICQDHSSVERATTASWAGPISLTLFGQVGASRLQCGSGPFFEALALPLSAVSPRYPVLTWDSMVVCVQHRTKLFNNASNEEMHDMATCRLEVQL